MFNVESTFFREVFFLQFLNQKIILREQVDMITIGSWLLGRQSEKEAERNIHFPSSFFLLQFDLCACCSPVLWSKCSSSWDLFCQLHQTLAFFKKSGVTGIHNSKYTIKRKQTSTMQEVYKDTWLKVAKVNEDGVQKAGFGTRWSLVTVLLIDIFWKTWILEFG